MTTYEKLLQEAKEQYDREIQEQRKLSVKKLLDATLPTQEK